MGIFKTIRSISFGLRSFSLSTNYRRFNKLEEEYNALYERKIAKYMGAMDALPNDKMKMREKGRNLPRNQFTIYYQEHAKTDGEGGHPSSDRMKILAAKWNKLPQEKKDEYRMRYEKGSKEYSAWFVALAPELTLTIQQNNFYARLKKKGLHLQRQLDALERDRPPGVTHGLNTAAWNLYLKETAGQQEKTADTENQKKSKTPVSKKREKFNGLSPTEKQQWIDKAREWNEQKAFAYSAWEKQIEQDGRKEEISELKRNIRLIKRQLTNFMKNEIEAEKELEPSGSQS